MSTPITDAVTGHSPLHKVENLQWVARRLETDRAALMEALAEIHQESEMGSFAEFRAQDALTAARANFPADIIGG